VKPDLFLVLPAYNEERRIPGSLERLKEFGARTGIKMQLSVVDDGSTDSTCQTVTAWATANAGPAFGVQLLKAAHRGKGAAVRAGMMKADAPIVGYCDVDLSAGPDALQTLYSAITQGADLAMASRGMAGSILEVRQSWYRERAGRLFNWFLRKVTGIAFRDTQCGLKLFRAEAAAEIFRLQRVDGFAFDAEVVLLAGRLGLEIQEIPVRWTNDPDSKISYFRDSTAVLIDTIRVIRRLRRGSVHAPGIPIPDAMDRMVNSEQTHWWHIAKRNLVMSILANEPTGRCLDLGCGGGAMLAEAASIGDVFGVDLSGPALGHAKTLGLANLVKSEASVLPFADAVFGAVLALDVIEHHPRPEEVLAETRRVLQPGGILIVTVPAFAWMWSYADHVLGHYRRYRKAQLGAEIRRAGFETRRLTYFHSWLLPIAWVFRRIRGLLGHQESADDFGLPGPLNHLLGKVSAGELALLGKTDLPFGLSLLAVARPAAAIPAGPSSPRAST